MDAGAWVGILVTAVVLAAVFALLVPRIREVREEQVRSKAIDEFYKARDREAAREHEELHQRDITREQTHA